MVDQKTNYFKSRVLSLLHAARQCINDFFLQPPRSPFKKLFVGTKLGEELRAMSFAKSVPKGLKWFEGKHGIGGKNSPMRYIPEKHPMQDALEKSKKTTFFKLTLLNMGNELKVAIWVSGTHKQFLLHVQTEIHV